MIISSETAEKRAIEDAAARMCATARTAPKAKGTDMIVTAVVTGEDKDRLSEEMRKMCGYDEKHFFMRDAGNVDSSGAVVLIGTLDSRRGLGKMCGLCGFDGCGENANAGAVCSFDAIDLGIAVGSAVSVAADMRIDNRVMFSVGKAAQSLGILGECTKIMGIPLSVSGKSPMFDR